MTPLSPEYLHIKKLQSELREVKRELAATSAHLDAAYEAAGLSKTSSEPLASHILRMRQRSSYG